MLTTDQLLNNLVDNGSISQSDKILDQDKKIFSSLRHQLKKQVFLTEKQGNLLVKLLQSNKKYLQHLTTEELFVINTPFWSQEFRLYSPVRKIYFSNEKKDSITVEFSYDKELKQKLNKEFDLSVSRRAICSTANKITIHNNEYNILKLIQIVKNDNFEIENSILEIYQRIELAINNHTNYIDILNEKNQNLYNIVVKDISNEDNTDLFLLDRRIRFQYNYESKNTQNTLSYKIASRKNSTVYVSSKIYKLQDIFKAFDQLKRLPTLIIFDEHEPLICNNLLDELNNVLQILDINNKTGIYFRFNNNVNKLFNQKIAEYNFNQYLDYDTNIVGISLKQLPKFLLKTDWYPKSVISLTANFRHSKVWSYCNQSDLIIFYSAVEPLTRNHDVVL